MKSVKRVVLTIFNQEVLMQSYLLMALMFFIKFLTPLLSIMKMTLTIKILMMKNLADFYRK